MPSVVKGEGSLLAVNLSLKTLNIGEQSSGSPRMLNLFLSYFKEFVQNRTLK